MASEETANRVYSELPLVKTRRLAIMQPYLFPYIGYFHLINAAELFVIYDDVNYINKGWINRNRILLNKESYLFTVPISNASQNKQINEMSPLVTRSWLDKFHKQLVFAYKKAPYFSDVIENIMSVFNYEHNDIADLAISSIKSIYDYVGLELNYTKSSICASESKGLEKAERLIVITKDLGYKSYINSIGGKQLYQPEYFSSKQVDLSFVISNEIEYRQYSSPFVPNLSIIDVVMFNEKDQIKEFMSSYGVE